MLAGECSHMRQCGSFRKPECWKSACDHRVSLHVIPELFVGAVLDLNQTLITRNEDS
jgi:hypothetical protein